MLDSFNEKGYLSILKIIEVGVFILDLKANILFINDEAKNILGTTEDFSNLETLVNKLNCKNYNYIKNKLSLSTQIFNRKANDFVLSFFSSNGAKKYISVSLKPHIVADKKIKIIALIKDISENKISEEEVKNTLKTKETLCRIIAHDIKSPFNSMIGLLQVIRKNLKESNIEKSIEIIELLLEDAKTSYNMIDNLFNWYSSQSNKIKFNPGNIRLIDILQGIEKLLRSTSIRKNIKIKFNIAPKLEVFCDSDMITIILRNLLTNAIKFSHKNGSILINSYLTDNYTIIEIIDNGIGINDETKQKLFDTNQIFSTLGTEYEAGTGLGLLICKELIDYHKGDISVESKVAYGSKFKIKLPITKSSFSSSDNWMDSPLK